MNCKMEDSYQPGKELFYHESGEVDRVRVLSNECNDDWIKYELEVIENIKRSGIFKPSAPGDIFECSRRRSVGAVAGMWSFTETN